MDAPAAPTNAYTPMAFARSPGSGNSATTMPSTTAEDIAAPMPCRNRAATSISALIARPQSSEASTNSVRPASSIRRRPKRSPIRPASSSRPPNGTR